MNTRSLTKHPENKVAMLSAPFYKSIDLEKGAEVLAHFTKIMGGGGGCIELVAVNASFLVIFV
jgi:hypothetical protein